MFSYCFGFNLPPFAYCSTEWYLPHHRYNLCISLYNFTLLMQLITSMILRFFIGYGLELSRIIPLIIFHLKRKYMCKTEAELKAAWYPGDLGYATRVPGDMLILTIVLCYSIIAPLIIPFGVVYFGLGWLVLRNQVMFLNFCTVSVSYMTKALS